MMFSRRPRAVTEITSLAPESRSNTRFAVLADLIPRIEQTKTGKPQKSQCCVLTIPLPRYLSCQGHPVD